MTFHLFCFKFLPLLQLCYFLVPCIRTLCWVVCCFNIEFAFVVLQLHHNCQFPLTLNKNALLIAQHTKHTQTHTPTHKHTHTQTHTHTQINNTQPKQKPHTRHSTPPHSKTHTHRHTPKTYIHKHCRMNGCIRVALHIVCFFMMRCNRG